MRNAADVVLLALCTVAAPVRAGEAEALAGRLVKASGVRAGLCVHLGVGDGVMTAALSQDGRFLVHGLDPDAARVAAARKAILEKDVYGRVSVERGTLAKLPYAENLVNLVVAEKADGLSFEEVFRVLAPDGVLMMRDAGLEAKLKAAGFKDVAAAPGLAGWLRAVKPRPPEMDDWEQWAHGPGRNPVSQDKLAGPPTRLRWLAAPWISRSHTASNLNAVTAKGRIFYPSDEAPPYVQGPLRVYLTARDAYNGLLLWKRERPVPGTGARVCFYSPRSLLATDGERVYTTLEPNGPLVALDAATGGTVWTGEKSLAGSPYDLLLHEGAVLVAGGGTLSSLDPKTGAKKWSVNGGGSLAAGEGRVFVQNRDGGVVAGLDARTGGGLWHKDYREELGRSLKVYSCVSGVLVCRGGRGVHHGLSAKDGAHLWTHKGGQGIPYVAGGLVWIPQSTGRGSVGPLVAIDLKTGEEKKRTEFRSGKGVCLAAAQPGTERYHIYGRHDYVERETGRNWHIRSTRRSCGFSVMPANGLIYTWPVDCRCYPMLSGVMGLAPSEAPLPDPVPGEGGTKTNAAATPLPPVENVLGEARLEKGPAGPAALKPGPEDWPAWRCDAERSGCSPTKVPAEVKLLWERTLGGEITPPSAACGLVFVASRDGQQVHALDAASGAVRWTYALGGPVDTPPTIHEGMCLFGSRDGWVYALNAADGRLVWRFRAAPSERRIIAFERLESAWPVYGSVMVAGGTAYFTAGRHTHLDGGYFVYGADPRTGKVLWHTRAEGTAPCDVPVKGPTTVQVWAGKIKFDLKTGEQVSSGKEDKDALQTGMLLLNPVWVHGRKSWFRGDAQGEILVLDGQTTYGVAAKNGKSNLQMVGEEGYDLFAAQGRKRMWSVTVPVRMRGLVKAGDLLFAAGAPDVADPKDYWAAFDGKLGGRLLAFSARNGKKVSEMKIDALPVPDGLIAASGRLCLSTRDGRVLCFGK